MRRLYGRMSMQRGRFNAALDHLAAADIDDRSPDWQITQGEFLGIDWLVEDRLQSVAANRKIRLARAGKLSRHVPSRGDPLTRRVLLVSDVGCHGASSLD